MDVVVRSRLEPGAAAAAVRAQVAAVDPGLPVFAVRTLDDLVSASWARRRAALTLLGAFAALATRAPRQPHRAARRVARRVTSYAAREIRRRATRAA